MRGIALVETMARSAAQAAEESLARGRAESEAIRSQARAANDRRRAQSLAETQADIDRLAARARMILEQNAQRDALSIQHRVAEEVLARGRQEIQRLAGEPDFGPVLEDLAASVLAEAEREHGGLDGLVVLAPPAHLDRIRKWVSGRGYAGLTVEPSAGLLDGVAVQDAARTFRISHTLAGRFDKLENEIRALCLTRLFGGGK